MIFGREYDFFRINYCSMMSIINCFVFDCNLNNNKKLTAPRNVTSVVVITCLSYGNTISLQNNAIPDYNLVLF